MKLSVLDFGFPGITVRLAPQVDEWGYSRYWLGEHHSPAQSGNPLLLAGIVAERTHRIRVGSAGVLINYHAPYLVAEDALQLEYLNPGRIDLGVCSGMALTDQVADAIRDGRDGARPPVFAERAEELFRLVQRRLPEAHPLHRERIGMMSDDGAPACWIMGTSAGSAQLAGRLGAGFCFSEHHRRLHGLAVDGPALLQLYLASFQPSAALAAPQTVVAVSGVCADGDAEAEELLRSEFPGVQDPTRPLSLLGGPARCAENLHELARRFATDEIAILPMIMRPRQVERCERMFELLAGEIGLGVSPAGG
jgi:luciferase family oxidoreductase group 1